MIMNDVAGDTASGGDDVNPAAGQENGGGDGGGGSPPQPYFPEKMPDHLRGTDDKGTIENLFEAYSSARVTIGENGGVPADASGYKIELSEAAQTAFPTGDDDKVMPMIREAALSHGLTDKQIGFIPSLVDKLIEGGVIEAPLSGEAVLAGLAPENFQGDDAARLKAGTDRQAASQQWIEALSKDAGYSDQVKEALSLLTFEPGGLAALELWKGSGVMKNVNPDGGDAAGGVTEADLIKRQADPRNDRYSDKYEPGYAEETIRLYKELYPD